jgi:hypothetical protein
MSFIVAKSIFCYAQPLNSQQIDHQLLNREASAPPDLRRTAGTTSVRGSDHTPPEWIRKM